MKLTPDQEEQAKDATSPDAPESLQDAMIRLHQQIFDNDYWVLTFSRILHENGMSHDGIENKWYTDAQIIELANKFWEVLPDHAGIRRTPFLLLCDIAERIFDEDEDQESNSAWPWPTSATNNEGEKE